MIHIIYDIINNLNNIIYYYYIYIYIYIYIYLCEHIGKLEKTIIMNIIIYLYKSSLNKMFLFYWPNE